MAVLAARMLDGWQEIPKGVLVMRTLPYTRAFKAVISV